MNEAHGPCDSPFPSGEASNKSIDYSWLSDVVHEVEEVQGGYAHSELHSDHWANPGSSPWDTTDFSYSNGDQFSPNALSEASAQSIYRQNSSTPFMTSPEQASIQDSLSDLDDWQMIQSTVGNNNQEIGDSVNDSDICISTPSKSIYYSGEMNAKHSSLLTADTVTATRVRNVMESESDTSISNQLPQAVK